MFLELESHLIREFIHQVEIGNIAVFNLAMIHNRLILAATKASQLQVSPHPEPFHIIFGGDTFHTADDIVHEREREPD